MGKLSILLFLIVLGGCATEFIVPTNRFITPESNGGFLRGQIELQKTQGVQSRLKPLRVPGEPEGEIESKTISRSGFMYSTSFFESFDFIWSHVGSANSMLGGKVQFFGGSRGAKAAGHKLAGALLTGKNRHMPASKEVDFTLSGTEWLLIYGYRINEMFMPYCSFGNSTYTWEVAPNAGAYGYGGELNHVSQAQGLNFGLDASYAAFFGKLEISYQKINSDAGSKNYLNYGISAGVSW